MRITIYEASSGDIITDQCEVVVGEKQAGQFRPVFHGDFVPEAGWAFARITSSKWRGYEWLHRDVLLASDGVVMVERKGS